MNCATCQDHIVDYLYGELDDTQRRAFEDALEQCPDCVAELAALRQLLAATDHAPPLELTAEQRSVVLAAAKDAAIAAHAPKVVPLFRRPGFQTAIAAVFSIGIASWVFLRSDQLLDRATEFPAPVSQEQQVAQDMPREDAPLAATRQAPANARNNAAPSAEATAETNAEARVGGDEDYAADAQAELAAAPRAVAENAPSPAGARGGEPLHDAPQTESAQVGAASSRTAGDPAGDAAAAAPAPTAIAARQAAPQRSLQDEAQSADIARIAAAPARRAAPETGAAPPAEAAKDATIASARAQAAAAPSAPSPTARPSTRSDNNALGAPGSSGSVMGGAASGGAAMDEDQIIAQYDAAVERNAVHPRHRRIPPEVIGGESAESEEVAFAPLSATADVVGAPEPTPQPLEADEELLEATPEEALADANQVWEANDFTEAYERFVEIDAKHRNELYRDPESLYHAADSARRLNKPEQQLRWTMRYLELAPTGRHAAKLQLWLPPIDTPVQPEDRAPVSP